MVWQGMQTAAGLMGIVERDSTHRVRNISQSSVLLTAEKNCDSIQAAMSKKPPDVILLPKTDNTAAKTVVLPVYCASTVKTVKT